MKKLNTDEIQNIALLLLSPDSKNIELAIGLLKNNQYAIPQLIYPITIFLIFNPNHKTIKQWVSFHLPNFSIKESAAYAIYLAWNKSEELTDNKSILDRFIEQEANYEKWILLDPNRAKVYANLAEFSLKMDEPDLAAQYYRLAVKHLPNSAYINYNLANTLAFYPPRNESLENYSSEIINGYTTLYPKYSRALNAYAMHHLRLKNWARAKDLAEQSLEVLTKNKKYDSREHSLDTLAYVYWWGYQDYPTAENYFKKALAIKQDHWDSIIGLAKMNLELGQTEKSIKWHKKALELQPKNVEVLENLAKLYLDIEEPKLAIDCYSMLLKIAPDHLLALKSLQLLTKK